MLRMNWPCALLVALLLGLVPAACGGGGRKGAVASRSSSKAAATTAGGPARPASYATLPQIEVKSDPDSDSDAYWTQPDDEKEVFGRLASATDARTATTVLKRYYAAAAAGDGNEGCRLLYTPLAESVVQDYGGPTGPPGLRGGACAVILPKLFRQTHRRLSAESATLKVAAVRVVLNLASARFGFQGGKASHYILLHRERGHWRVGTLVDVERPLGVE